MSEQSSDKIGNAGDQPPTEGAERPTSDESSLGEDVLAAAREADSIDLTRYKTTELKNRFQRLFGVVHLLPWAGAGFAGPIAAALLAWGVLFLPRATAFIAALTLIYMGLQGFFLGVAAASLLVITRIFQQLTAIVDITIQTLRQAFSDIGRIGDPAVRAELTGALIHGAIIPSVQSVIAVKVGLLRAPISFVLNRLLGRTAKKLTRNIEQKAQSGALPALSPDDSPAPTSDEESEDSHLDRMQDRIETIARRTRKATLIPAIVLFTIATGVSSIPWLVAFFLLV